MDVNSKPVPKMRTVSKTVASLRAMDPETEVTEHFIRKLLKNGTLKASYAGNKALINLDDVLELLYNGTPPPQVAEECAVKDIRRLDKK